jgi:hypothetical protein
LGFKKISESSLCYTNGKFVGLLLKAKDIVTSDVVDLGEFYNIVQSLQASTLAPVKRRCMALQGASNSMYMIGCSKQWKEDYAGTRSIQQLELLQPIINYIVEIFKNIMEELELNSKDYTPCSCEEHRLKLHLFKRGAFSYDYCAPAHMDNDKTLTVFLTLWPHGGTGGEFFCSEAGCYFTPEHGDIIIFNGNFQHGTCLCVNNNRENLEKKVSVALFS